MQRQTDPYLRERLHDLDDLANRLLHQLTGQSFVLDRDALPDNAILVARSMGPAALLDYPRNRLRGLVLEHGGPTSHVAIIARALGIPTVGNLPNITDLVEQGDAIIVDGAMGDVHVRPQPDVEAAYGAKARLRATRQEQYQKLRDVAPVTRDGTEMTLGMNAGLLVDVQHVAETGAACIGLFRTELQFMVAARFPRASEQLALYRAVLDAVPDRPIVFRTLDIGSDKVLPYMREVEGEENPALGWRAIRIGLDRPGLLRQQLRALLRAGGGRSMHIMFPMVATVSELDAAREMTLAEIAHLERYGHPVPTDLRLGVMVEVPSLLWELDAVCQRADFLSVGSNDLLQYMFAADRENKRVADRFDPLSPAALRALKSVADAGARTATPVSLCGEMGGRTLEALALAALGYRSLSMSPASIGPVKATLLSADLADVREFLLPLLDDFDDPEPLRTRLRTFAEDRGIVL